jgi:bifunctional non-homologous end joining protein LigD
MISKHLEPLTAPGSLLAGKIAPMLAYAAKPFDSPRYLFEIKWDGTRCLTFIRGPGVRLQNRRLQDITVRYPDLAGIYRQFNADNAILDGELVALTQGRSDFRKLQQREQLANALKIELAARRIPVTYMVFDVLYLNGESCLHRPLQERKGLLAEILQESDQVLESKFILERGRAFFQEAVAQGLEGVMAKGLASPYLIGKRSRSWLKIKPRGRASCYIVGYSPGQGARRQSFGSLALATPEAAGWKFRGMVGSGFSDALLADISRRLQNLRVDRPAIPLEAPLKGIIWVKPEMRCEVSFQEETPRGHFRAPVFAGLIQ